MDPLITISKNVNTIAEALISSKLVVLLTDTIYGIVACALNQEAFAKLYSVKGREPAKPSIILISSINDMFDLGVSNEWQEEVVKYWPGPNSLILPTARRDLNYLTGSSGKIALRLPDNKALCSLIDLTGPLAAPSANPEGLSPATSISQAKAYFGDQVDVYVDGGDISNAQPSHLIDLATHKTLR